MTIDKYQFDTFCENYKLFLPLYRIHSVHICNYAHFCHSHKMCQIYIYQMPERKLEH